MKPKDFLEWYRYKIGSKRMYKNYGLIRRHNPDVFEKLKASGKFKYEKEQMGKLLEFPKREEE